MPKDNSLLRYLKIDSRSKRLTYTRQIPPLLRPYLGGRASIRRTLPTESTDCRSTSVLTAYAEVHSEVDRLITQAKAKAEGTNALFAGQSTAITAPDATLPLSRREIAGIAGQVLLDMRNHAADQRLMPAEYGRCVVALAIKMKTQGIASVSDADFGVIARPVLDQLQITPSPADMEAIGQALMAYRPVMAADMAKLADMNFSPPALEAIAPPLPTRQTTWRDLIEAWRRSKGGILERDGIGISQDREPVYHLAIQEFQRIITDKAPSALTLEDARAYMRYLQTDSAIAPRTQQHRVGCLRHLLKIGMREGLVEANVFEGQVITTPAGSDDEKGYRPFTKQELVAIFTELKANHTRHRTQLCYLLLCTGCRLNDALQLRSFDLRQTDTGIWYFNWKHEPTSVLPMLLKSKSRNNRQTPLHQRLIDEGILDLDRSKPRRLLADNMPTKSSYSAWFKLILQKQGIWESRRTGLHSIRGTAKDLQREAGIPAEIRMALTAHTSRDAGESMYGDGLQQQPKVLYEQLKKLDLTWLP